MEAERKEGLAARAGSAASELNGIPESTLSQQVAVLEYRCAQLNQMLGEVIATCLVNLESRALKCDDPIFRKYIESRSSFRVQLMGDSMALQPNAPASATPNPEDNHGS